jgi:hypothetical protein
MNVALDALLRTLAGVAPRATTQASFPGSALRCLNCCDLELLVMPNCSALP